MSDDTKERHTRLWTYALHEDAGFGHRSDFFLLANSFLVVAYAGLLGNEQPGDAGRLALAARVIAIFGILLSIAWLYVSRRQWLYSVYVYGRAEREMPDVASIFAQRRQPGLSGTAVMAYVVPGLAFAMWLALAILV